MGQGGAQGGLDWPRGAAAGQVQQWLLGKWAATGRLSGEGEAAAQPAAAATAAAAA